jgi:hypothetical protein
MTGSFQRDVERAFEFLHDEPGHQLLEVESSASFDNAAVYFRSDRLRVRIIRERSQVFAEFAPPDGPPTWCDAPTLIGCLGSEALVDVYTREDQRSLAALADLIRPFYGAITELYAAPHRDNNLRRIRAFQEEQARLRWG